jgi:hypothetical protein
MKCDISPHDARSSEWSPKAETVSHGGQKSGSERNSQECVLQALIIHARPHLLSLCFGEIVAVTTSRIDWVNLSLTFPV